MNRSRSCRQIKKIASKLVRKGDKTSLAENGDCGVFAVALLRELAQRGIYNANIVIIADADDWDDNYPIPFDAFYDMDIFHICVDINGKYYDIRGKRNIEEMLKHFVPYGGGGIEPKDYTPTDGRDYVGDSYAVPDNGTIKYLEDFVMAATNAHSSVDEYKNEAQDMVNKIYPELTNDDTNDKLSNLISWLDRCGFAKEAEEAFELTKTAVLKRLKRTTRGKGKRDRMEWALVSKSNPKKILKWFGPDKPSKKEVAKEERRVHAFG